MNPSSWPPLNIECSGYEWHRQVFIQNLETLDSSLTTPNDILNLILKFNGSTERNHDQRILSNETIYSHTTIYNVHDRSLQYNLG